MNLYSVHCGFYDRATGDGVYESHVNMFVAAESFSDAKKKAKALPRFKDKKMHVDGLQQISVVDGYAVKLEKQPSDATEVKNLGWDELKALSSSSLQ